MLSERFGASVDRAGSIAEAISDVREKGYDLVLVNRILDANAEEGLELIRQLREDEQTRDVEVMLVSNYEDAQEAAVAMGARPGFGKAKLDVASTVEALAHWLGRP